VAACVGEIACLKTKCAPHSITVPLIKRSVASIGHKQFVLLDETIFTSSPEGVRSTTQFLLTIKPPSPAYAAPNRRRRRVSVADR
jgi:hypothetical protein